MCSWLVVRVDSLAAERGGINLIGVLQRGDSVNSWLREKVWETSNEARGRLFLGLHLRPARLVAHSAKRARSTGTKIGKGPDLLLGLLRAEPLRVRASDGQAHEVGSGQAVGLRQSIEHRSLFGVHAEREALAAVICCTRACQVTIDRALAECADAG